MCEVRSPTVTENYRFITGFLRSDKVQKFSELENEREKLRFIFEHEAYWPLSQTLKKLKRDSQGKDKKISKSLRDAGNEEFKNNKDSEALDYYNQAVLLAPCDTNAQGEDLAIALANRAAVLLRQEKYTHSITDMELASKSGYPIKMRHKLLNRHAKALMEMYRFNEAENKFKEAIEALEVSELSQEQKTSLVNEMTKSIMEMRKKDGLEKAIKDFMKNPSMAVPVDMRLEKLSIKPNKSNPSFSSEIEVQKGENKSVSVKAKHDINTGIVVGLEDPLSHLLHPNNQLTHCCYCVAPVVLPVACQGCIDVIFCSAKCRDYAWNTYHKFECSLVEANSVFQEEVLLAFRLICKHQGDLESLEKDVKRSSIEKEVDNEEELTYLSISALLIKHLKEQNFFETKSNEISEIEMRASELLRKFIDICRIRTQAISEVDSWDVNKGLGLKSIGIGYNPFLSSLKHSCDPNVVRCNLGTASFLISTKKIPEDGEITYSYQVNFQDYPQSERENILWDDFRIRCNCKPCEENWPTSSRLTKTSIVKGMEKFVADLKRNYAQAVSGSQADLNSGYYDKVFSSWANYYEKLSRVVQPPHQGYLRIAREIENCAWLKYGNHRPMLKAPVYKDHTKIKPENENTD